LRQHQAGLHLVGGDQPGTRQLLAVDAVQGLAVNGDRLPPTTERGLRPLRQHRLELRHSGRPPARKAERLHHLRRLLATPLRNGVEAAGPTEHRHGRQR
jgi:hypothetical protein